MKTLPIILFSSFALSLAMSEVLPASEQTPQSPFVVKETRENEQAIAVESASYEARIVGRLCETTITMTLRNPNSRDMEGEFSFPLPLGATISGYALDVEGKLVDAVPVTKQKARVVLEEEARQGADPGIAESVGGNMFRTRIYPMPAQGTRTVRFRYISELAQGNLFELPLNFATALKEFSLKLELVTDTTPKIASSPISNISFEKQETLFVAEKKLTDIALTESIVVELPPAAKAQPLIEKYDGRYYALIPHNPKQEIVMVSEVPRAPILYIFWDASASMENADHQAAIDAICKLIDSGIYEKVNIVAFRQKWYLVGGVNDAADFRRYLENMKYDGATGNMKPALDKFNDRRAADMIVVSDGLFNYGPEEKFDEATVALMVSSQADVPALKRRGAVVMRPEELDTSKSVAENVAAQRRFTGFSLPDGPWVSALATQETYSEAQPGFVLGILPEGAHGVSYYTTGGAYHFNLDTAQAKEGQFVRTLYGQAQLNRLEQEAPSPQRRQQMQAIGQDYGIVTKGTSLLVLENLEQYQRHQVRPPASAVQMRQEYDAYMAANLNKLNAEKALKLEEQCVQMKTLWAQELAWYEQDFSAAKPNPRGGNDDDDEDEGSFGSQVVSAIRGFFSDDDDCEMECAPVVAPVMLRALDEEDCDEDGGEYADEDDGGVEKDRIIGPPDHIEVKPWASNAPYILKLAEAEDKWECYIELKKEYGTSPGFYLDCSDYFAKMPSHDHLAEQILSNLMEMNLEDRSLLRVLGYKLRFTGHLEQARFVLERVLELFPEEPQSYRDLALVLEELGQSQEAFELYLKLFAMPIHERFRGIEQIALVEMNRLVARAKASGMSLNTQLVEGLIQPVEADIRVVLNWDTDNSDMDLWVTDVAGEKCFYSHRQTATGGQISRDVTQGYGPEEFRIKTARAGKYKVEADYYGTDTAQMLAPVTLYAEIFTNYGRPNERREVQVFRLDNAKQVVHVADVDLSTVQEEPSSDMDEE